MENVEQISDENTIDSAEQKEVEYDMDALRAKAKLLGIDFNSRIGGKKLKAKIDAHIVEMETSSDEKESVVGSVSTGPSNKIKDAEKAARKKVLVIITDTDTRDVDNPTIVHGVMNRYFKIGPEVIKKDTEQFVSTAIVNALKSKTTIKMVPSINHITKRPTGNKVAETRKRYSIAYVVAN